jgi:hypothetical protein
VTYAEYIEGLKSAIPKEVVDLNLPRKRGSRPTQAFSDFLTHKEQGDWAEQVIQAGMAESQRYIPVAYGRADNIIAGDSGFAQFYEDYQDELDAIGKKPDILLFDKSNFEPKWMEELKSQPTSQLLPIVSKAKAGLEVRSSAYMTKKFVPTDDRPYLSFTPKVEDLLVILKWIETYGVPHYYVQVFFDAIYVIPFKDILLLLKNAEYEVRASKIKGRIDGNVAFIIERNPKNQFKATIHIFLNRGEHIGSIASPPDPVGVRKELASGRLLHYVTFKNFQSDLNLDLIEQLVQKPV